MRAYEADAYLARIEVGIDRAGKQADYIKLFRFDGPMPLARWKSLLTAFYRGNRLIPEYLGDEGEQTLSARSGTPDGEPEPEAAGEPQTVAQPTLAALVSFSPANREPPLGPVAEDGQAVGDSVMPFVEIGLGRTAAWMQARYDLSAQCTLGFRHGILNLSLIGLGDATAGPNIWDETAAGLAAAFDADAGAGLTQRLSCSFAWTDGELQTRLSIVGDARRVAAVLENSVGLVSTLGPASAWIDAFAALVERHAEDAGAEIDWRRTRKETGRLYVPRSGEVEVVISPPRGGYEAMKAALIPTDAAAEAAELDGGGL